MPYAESYPPPHLSSAGPHAPGAARRGTGKGKRVRNRRAAQRAAVTLLQGGARPGVPGHFVRPVEATSGRCYLSGMADAAFDTLAMTRQLKARGFDADQAEAITEVVRAGVTGGVATKADLADLRGDLRTEIAEVETRLTWRIVIVGLALNSASAAAVIAAVGWMLSGS